jgi:hypothetical protein
VAGEVPHTDRCSIGRVVAAGHNAAMEPFFSRGVRRLLDKTP